MPSFTLKKCFRFEAAHYLPHHEGKCRRLHGHSWVGWVEVSGSELKTSGSQTDMLVDFGVISAAVKPMLEEFFDHYLLNETLKVESPTSEVVAQWVYRHLEQEPARTG